MKNHIKLLLFGGLAVLIPFAVLIFLLKVCDNHHVAVLSEIAAVIAYSYPLYLPIISAIFGTKAFKVTGKVFVPTLLYNIYLSIASFVLSLIATEATMTGDAGDMAAVGVFLLLFIPTIYSIPISPIAAAICKYRNKKQVNKDENL